MPELQSCGIAHPLGDVSGPNAVEQICVSSPSPPTRWSIRIRVWPVSVEFAPAFGRALTLASVSRATSLAFAIANIQMFWSPGYSHKADQSCNVGAPQTHAELLGLLRWRVCCRHPSSRASLRGARARPAEAPEREDICCVPLPAFPRQTGSRRLVAPGLEALNAQRLSLREAEADAVAVRPDARDEGLPVRRPGVLPGGLAVKREQRLHHGPLADRELHPRLVCRCNLGAAGAHWHNLTKHGEAEQAACMIWRRSTNNFGTDKVTIDLCIR